MLTTSCLTVKQAKDVEENIMIYFSILCRNEIVLDVSERKFYVYTFAQSKTFISSIIRHSIKVFINYSQ